MINTVLYIHSNNSYKIVERGDIGTLDLLNVLKTLMYGFRKDHYKIDRNKNTPGFVSCKIEIEPTTSNISTGSVKALDIANCIELIMSKYCREICAEARELQGILKGKDLERYIDLMVSQNNAKSNKYN